MMLTLLLAPALWLGIAPLAPAPKPTSAEPSFAALFAQTGSTGTPVVVELSTTWCKPCQEMAKNVFPDERVKRALSRYRFQSFDAEGAHADEVLQRFKTTTYPDVVVLTPDGTVVEHLPQQDPAGFAAALDEILPLARTRGPVTNEELARRPHDAGLMYLLGQQALRTGDSRAADALFERAEHADLADVQRVSTRATWQRLLLLGPDIPAAMKADRLLGLARRTPQSQRTLKALEGLAALVARGTPAPAGSHEALMAYARTQTDVEVLNGLDYAALALGDTAGALVISKRLEGLTSDPNVLDTVAEAHFQAGEREDAVARESALLKKDPGNAELAKSVARFRTGPLGLPAELVPADPWSHWTKGEPESAVPTAARVAVLLSHDAKTLAELCAGSLGGAFKKVRIRVHLEAGRVKKAEPEITPPSPGAECLARRAAGAVHLPSDITGDYVLSVRARLSPLN